MPAPRPPVCCSPWSGRSGTPVWSPALVSPSVQDVVRSVWGLDQIGRPDGDPRPDRDRTRSEYQFGKPDRGTRSGDQIEISDRGTRSGDQIGRPDRDKSVPGERGARSSDVQCLPPPPLPFAQAELAATSGAIATCAAAVALNERDCGNMSKLRRRRRRSGNRHRENEKMRRRRRQVEENPRGVEENTAAKTAHA
eukprot:gene9522-biopygen21243